MEYENNSRLSFASETDSQIHLTIADCYSFRVMMDILSTFKNEITIRFNPDFIKIEECNQRETAFVKFEMFGSEMLSYNYDVKDEHGNLLEMYAMPIKANDAYSTIKNEGKKDPITCYVDINGKTLSNSGLYFHRAGSSLEALDFVHTKCGTTQVQEYIDHYAKSYSELTPNSRMSTAAFAKMISNFKTRKCNRVVFSCNMEGAIIVKGQRNDDVITAYRLPGMKINTLDEYEYASPDTNDGSDMIFNSGEGGNGITIHVNNNHTITLNLANLLWIAKISRLAPMAILKIYMKHDCPLVLRTPLGLYGVCTFSFNSDVPTYGLMGNSVAANGFAGG